MPTQEDFEKCHRLGHAWDDIPATKKPPFGVYVWERCLRCTGERHDIIQSFGDGSLLSRKYYYPDGYKYAKGERPSRAEMRVMAAKRERRSKRKLRAV